MCNRIVYRRKKSVFLKTDLQGIFLVGLCIGSVAVDSCFCLFPHGFFMLKWAQQKSQKSMKSKSNNDIKYTADTNTNLCGYIQFFLVHLQILLYSRCAWWWMLGVTLSNCREPSVSIKDVFGAFPVQITERETYAQNVYYFEYMFGDH